ncbi:septation ring formation regulator EzrA [Aerococcus christensenii]|uniref:septation ring formation regulator EzrA n=1 Tax=Aerococcus christensenii TaxID=87541 RepID=UPI0007632E60|nr:septation ring formation regulator EzrA [Aerococcus christensenii]AMB91963.1 selenide, water dikinase [Aerococcus christensenii]
MGFIIALIIIIVIILISYGLLYYLGRKQTKINSELDEKKQDIMAIPVADKLYTIRNKNVSGNTQRVFEAEQAKWQTIKQYKLPEIEAALVQAQADTDKFSLIKARQTAEKTETLIEETFKEVTAINQVLQEILDSEHENEEYYQKTYQAYAEIRKQLLAHGYAYEDSQEVLKKNLSYIELDFTKYNAMMNDGDFMGAHEILDQTNEDIMTLQAMMKEIPNLYEKIENVYMEQLEDIRSGYAQLEEMAFQFPVDVHIPDEIKQVEKNIDRAREAVREADLTEAKQLLTATEVQIDRTYEFMQVELDAKDYIEKNQGSLQQRLSQIKQSNRYGSLEIDRVSQSYMLHENELGRMQDFADRLDRLSDKLESVNQRLGAHAIAYSDMEKVYKTTYEDLASIEKAQSHIVSTLVELKQKEKEARSTLYAFHLDIRNMKRRVGHYHLPGLSDEYLDKFFATEDLVDDFERKMNRVKLDMVEIDKMIQQLSDQMEDLDQETETLIDHALLTEQSIQYANRFRADYPEINQAIKWADHLFYDSYDYTGAYQVMSQAIDKIDPMASKNVVNQYQKDKQNRLI